MLPFVEGELEATVAFCRGHGVAVKECVPVSHILATDCANDESLQWHKVRGAASSSAPVQNRLYFWLSAVIALVWLRLRGCCFPRNILLPPRGHVE